MSHTYAELYFHCVWATKLREPLLTPPVEAAVQGYIRARCRDMGIFVHGLNGIEDHQHLVCSIPPRLSVAEVLDTLKGASSHYVNHLPDGYTCYWQRGYSAHTFSRRDLKRIVAYVENQKEHHRSGALWAALELPNDSEKDDGSDDHSK